MNSGYANTGLQATWAALTGRFAELMLGTIIRRARTLGRPAAKRGHPIA